MKERAAETERFHRGGAENTGKRKIDKFRELCGREKKSIFAKISSRKYLISFRPNL
jgi:hypothetical protein